LTIAFGCGRKATFTTGLVVVTCARLRVYATAVPLPVPTWLNDPAMNTLPFWTSMSRTMSGLLLRCSILTRQWVTICPFVGFNATMPGEATPLTCVKAPPASTMPSGSVANVWTSPLNVGRKPGTKVAVFTVNAARYGCSTRSAPVASAPFWTRAKLPPTNIIPLDSVNAWTSEWSSVPPSCM
jgi:hypothetical protein